MAQLLVETIEFIPVIVEDIREAKDGSPSVMKIEGVFQRADVKNANNRVYPRKLWEKILAPSSSVMKKLTERGMYGHLEHPADGVTRLSNGAILVTSLKLKEDGEIYGTAEVFDEFPGNKVKEYIRKKCRIGISSRGQGTVDSSGKISDDYVLETFDVVYNPSTPGAYPTETNRKEEGASGKGPNPSGVTVETKPPSSNNHSQEIDMLEKYTNLESSARSLMEQDTAHLERYQLTEISSKLLETAGKIGMLCKEDESVKAIASGLLEDISKKRTAIQEAISGKSNPSSAPASDDDDDSILEASEEVLENLDTLTEEKAVLTETVSEAGDEIEALDETVAAAEKLGEALQEKVVTLETEIEELKAQLETANTIIASLTEHDAVDAVEDAVESVIAANPDLEQFRDVLEDCSKPSKVMALAERLAEKVSADDEEEPEDEPDPEDDSEDDEMEASKKKGSKKEAKMCPDCGEKMADCTCDDSSDDEEDDATESTLPFRRNVRSSGKTLTEGSTSKGANLARAAITVLKG